nr:outer membrane protein assembly factor BamD [Gammaproteobacteria bacterium]
MSQLYRRAGLLVLLLLLGGCGMLGKSDDITEDWPVQRLYEEAKKAREGGDYQTAIDYYEKLESRYPFGPYAEQAQLEIAYSYYKYEEPASAIAAADRFIKLHPRHSNVDYAYYIKGLTNFHQGRGIVERYLPIDGSQRDPVAAQQAFQDFAELTQRFPESAYAADASRRMGYLRNQLARYELHVADYYLRRGAFVAAVNRGKYVLERYPQSTATPDALVVMAKAYANLELDALAKDALRVLKLNYPDHHETRKIEQLTQRGREHSMRP